jgi:transcriptional regulator with XRE-family HTH domain
MSGDPGPMVRRRLISACLRFYRERAGINAKNAAERILSDPSKITRLEKGQRAASARDVRDLCDVYGVPDDVRDELMSLARGVRSGGWWQGIGLPTALQTLIAMEGSASTISDFEVIGIPGFLQIREYAEEILGLWFGHDPKKCEDAVNARLRRREIFVGDSSPDIRVILDEAATSRLVGGKRVMRAQLEFLVEAVTDHGVDLRIIPFSAGAHIGISNGFTVLEVPKPPVFPAEIPSPGFVYLELSSGSAYLDDQDDVEQHLTTFKNLGAIALSVSESIDMLNAAAKKL